jgi:hypothetical protein
MKKFNLWATLTAAAISLLGLLGCATTGGGRTATGGLLPMTSEELNANAPAYWIGQRVFEQNRMTWGWLRREEQPWSQARLVLLKEDLCLAPHRAKAQPQDDHNTQYRLFGYYWDRKGYDPVINRLLDVFVLERFEVIGPADPLPLKSPGTAVLPARSGSRSSSRTGAGATGPATHQANYENIE